MSLANFSLDMSQELCHFFAGASVGGMFIFKFAFYFYIIYLLGKLITPTLEWLGKGIVNKIKIKQSKNDRVYNKPKRNK